MPIYNFHCNKCNKDFEDIVKIGQEYTQCVYCKSLSQRTHVDLPSEPVLYGEGFYKQSRRISPE